MMKFILSWSCQQIIATKHMGKVRTDCFSSGIKDVTLFKCVCVRVNAHT